MSTLISTDFALKLSGKNSILPYYHTVTDSPKAHYAELGYFRNLHDFLNDLDFFQKNFQNVCLEDFEESKKCFHLSFDDGLKDNFSVAANVLYDRKLDATFFINSDFIDNKKMFFRHKISLLLHSLKISQQNNELISNFLNIEISVLKNYIAALKNEDKIDEVAVKLDIDFNEYLQNEKPYLSLSELKEMKKMGFTIGNHSSSHARFSSLNFEKQKAEVELVNLFLKEENLANVLYFCFPFGDDLVKNQFFDWLYSDGEIQNSFGTAGLKKDHFDDHHHRILMEYQSESAKDIIKVEFIYYFLKSFFNKNILKR